MAPLYLKNRSMEIKIKSKLNELQLYDNYLRINKYKRQIDIDTLIDIADFNSGELYSEEPLIFYFPDTEKPSTDSAEIDNFILNIEQETGLKFNPKLKTEKR